MLERFLAGGLPADESQHLCHHVGECEECRAILQQLSDDHELRSWSLPPGRIKPAEQPEPALARVLDRLRETPPSESSTSLSTPDLPIPAIDFLSPPAREDELGMLGPYRILSQLGCGGMGLVLKAFDPQLDRTVAIKVLRPDRADARSRERFVREAQSAARISHDHVVPVYSVNSPLDGLPYFVMQYIDGPTLKDRIQREGRLEPREAARICQEVAEGLAAAHAAGLVHRDIKPANIILDPANGRAKIMDFGLVRLTDSTAGITQEGTIPGTPEYMSPEQIRDPNRIDARTDIYSLGVTLYECLTGETPFSGVPHMVLQQVLNDEPRPPRRLNDSIPRDLETICLKATRSTLAARYQTAEELQRELHSFLRDEPIKARPVGATERLWRWSRRNPRTASLVGIVGVLLIIIAVGSSILALQIAKERNSAIAARVQAEENAAATRAGRVVALEALYEVGYRIKHEIATGQAQTSLSDTLIQSLIDAVERIDTGPLTHSADHSTLMTEILIAEINTLLGRRSRSQLPHYVFDAVFLSLPPEDQKQFVLWCFWTGDSRFRIGAESGARDYYTRVARLCDALDETKREDVDLQMAHIAGYARLGDLNVREGKLEDAYSQFETALALLAAIKASGEQKVQLGEWRDLLSKRLKERAQRTNENTR